MKKRPNRRDTCMYVCIERHRFNFPIFNLLPYTDYIRSLFTLWRNCIYTWLKLTEKKIKPNWLARGVHQQKKNITKIQISKKLASINLLQAWKLYFCFMQPVSDGNRIYFQYVIIFFSLYISFSPRTLFYYLESFRMT